MDDPQSRMNRFKLSDKLHPNKNQFLMTLIPPKKTLKSHQGFHALLNENLIQNVKES